MKEKREEKKKRRIREADTDFKMDVAFFALSSLF
jgi:hypothetical protein